MEISNLILNWYKNHARELPWRGCSDPYKIWVSEIVLQQTQISRGLIYYRSFTEKFPDIFSLADADENDVLKIWQGLGYYTRARNMKFAANQIINDLDGVFPVKYNELLKLKGVGEYTAAAVSSIINNEAIPAIDGNALRVFSRIFGIYDDIGTEKGRKRIKTMASKIIHKTEPGNFNQAIMDLGALICIPRTPECEKCPLNTRCKAYNMDQVHEFPVRAKKTKTRERHLNYIVFENEDTIFLNQRGENDIWALLYDFPVIETKHFENTISILKKIQEEFEISSSLIVTNIIETKKHILSHQNLHIRFFTIRLNNSDEEVLMKRFLKVPKNEITNYTVPVPVNNYLREKKLI